MLGNNKRASILCRGVVTDTIPSEPHKSMKLNINRQKSLIIFNLHDLNRLLFIDAKTQCVASPSRIGFTRPQLGSNIRVPFEEFGN